MNFRLFYIFWLLPVVHGYAQKIKFQSAGNALAVTSSDGTISFPGGVTSSTGKVIHSGYAGAAVSQGSGNNNQSGFYFGNVDYRPAQQATGITFSNANTTSVTLGFTRGNGARRVVMAKAGAPVDAAPQDKTTYLANAAFGSGAQIGTGNYVLYDGGVNDANTLNVSGLNLTNTVYYFKVFEYNGKYGANTSNVVYQPNDGVNNPLASPPIVASSFVLPFSNLTNNQLTINWTNGNGANRIILVKAGSPVDAVPGNGASYNANSVFGSGDQLGTNNFVVYDGSGSIANVSGLSANTTYYFQIIEYNGTGASSTYSVSTTANKLTLTNATLATNATAIAQTSFYANWQQVTGAKNYYLDVATDTGFANMVSGFSNYQIVGGSSLTTSISGLSPGTLYYYRVRAENDAGQSANSNTIEVLTVPATPVVLVSTNIDITSFTTNWSASQSATDYFVDVAMDAGFTQFVGTFINKQVTGATSLDVNGLSAGTGYYIRVRSKNGSGTSLNAVNGYNQFTITEAPVALDASNEQISSFKAKWTTVTGATEYELNVLDDNTGISVSGYPKLFSHPQTEEIITGLTCATKYRFFIRGKNAGGYSANSNVKLAYTLTCDGKQVNPPLVTNNPSQSTINTVVAQITGGEVPLQINFKHRSITSSQFVAEPSASLATTNTSKSQSIDISWGDELGVEYYFVVKDNIGRKDSSTVNYVYQSFSGKNIPGFESGFDGNQNTYKMFSIPAEITSNRIDEIFQPVISQFGGYDQKSWRMFHYNSGQKNYDEYQFGLTTIEKGLGYWFNAVTVPAKLAITASVTQANQAQPFELTLEKGWNQVGNPYPFAINWNTIRSANPTVKFNSLYVFENKYDKRTRFEPWTGGFVFSDEGGTIKFPVTAKCSGCRTAEQEFATNLDESIWSLPLDLTLNELGVSGGIGMHPNAKISKDEFDEITVPRFLDYLEMDTYHPEFFAPRFSMDVVPQSNQQEWMFSMRSNHKEGKATLAWPQHLIVGSAQLLLIDIQEQAWVNMKEQSSYSFSWKPGKQMKIVYSKEKELNPGIFLLGNAYPNPFFNEVYIPVLVDEANTNIQIEIYNLMGQRIKKISQSGMRPGLHEVVWDGLDDHGNQTPAGMLLYRNTSENKNYQVKRMIKQ